MLNFLNKFLNRFVFLFRLFDTFLVLFVEFTILLELIFLIVSSFKFLFKFNSGGLDSSSSNFENILLSIILPKLN